MPVILCNINIGIMEQNIYIVEDNGAMSFGATSKLKMLTESLENIANSISTKSICLLGPEELKMPIHDKLVKDGFDVKDRLNKYENKIK